MTGSWFSGQGLLEVAGVVAILIQADEEYEEN
jgi:hypothetical protein